MGRIGGFLRALVGLGLLAGVGFGLGAVAGLVWEEPRLVMAYFTGETTEIAWAPVEGEEVGTRVAAEDPPEVDLPEASAAPRAPAPDPRPVSEPPSVAAAPPAGVAIQVGAFEDADSAERLAERLKKSGYDVYVAPGVSGAARWRVRVGPIASREEAERVAVRLKREEKLPTWVLEEGAS